MAQSRAKLPLCREAALLRRPTNVNPQSLCVSAVNPPSAKNKNALPRRTGTGRFGGGTDNAAAEKFLGQDRLGGDGIGPAPGAGLTAPSHYTYVNPPKTALEAPAHTARGAAGKDFAGLGSIAA